ncbi:MAG TPA: hypothetical protein PLJ12_05150, partial [Planctomycetota bacterium]|nr:hypothetical protein [Planctomycetota bacterium]
MVPTPDLQVRSQCLGCRHFLVTYSPNQPYGCRAFGFQSKQWPGRVVWQESRQLCGLREPQPGVLPGVHPGVQSGPR